MLTLAALYRSCVLQSQERKDTHDLVAQELNDHRLRWDGKAEVDTRLYKFSARNLSLYSLRYGDGVSIFPDTYTGFSLVHFSLNGGIEVRADGQAYALPVGEALLCSPKRRIELHWGRHSEQLILRIPHRALQQAARAMGQEARFRTLITAPGLSIRQGASVQWQAQLHAFMALDAYSRGDPAYQPWLAHVEQAIVTFLLLQASPTAACRMDTEAPRTSDRRPPATPQVRRRLERLHAFAAERLTTPVTLTEMAQAVALSERQLNTLCNEHLGMPPVIWLRQLRLDAVRSCLITDPNADLQKVTMMHGFMHQGRFSAYYRQRFGELPSQTIKSARIG